MLSRTAESLFWLGRYIERADNVARLLEAGRRLDAMAGEAQIRTNEWEAILIAAGCRTTFPGDLATATAAEAIQHMVVDPANPSSILSCYDNARANARAQRGAITADTWSAVNEAWRESRRLSIIDCQPRYIADTLERTRRFSALFRGAVLATMLRDERLSFLTLGQMVERADATARLLDVKYHVLMPADHPIGSGLDQLQWNNLLRAAGARTAYRWVYRKPVESLLVIDFLLLNTQLPRSFRSCIETAAEELGQLHAGGAAGQQSLTEVMALRADLRGVDAQSIVGQGLHEYLTKLIVHSNKLALSIGADFGFSPIVAEDTRTQSQ